MGVAIDLAALAGVTLLARLIALAQALETLRARELPSLPAQLTRHLTLVPISGPVLDMAG